MRVEEESGHDGVPAVQEVRVEEESDHDDDPAVQEVLVAEVSGHDGVLSFVVEVAEFDHVADGTEPYHSKMLHRALQVKSTSSL